MDFMFGGGFYLYGGTNGGKAICISACDDNQNSADTSAFTGNAIGALMYSFFKAVKSAYEPTNGDLLDNMRNTIRKVRQEQGLEAPFASPTSQVNLISTTNLNYAYMYS
ncbi:hypothetical protein Hdeb2414_s0004g00141841 [Helianthus debilis subsp. tardiflorus]